MFIMSLKQISNAQPQLGNQRGVYATKTPSLKKACRVSGTSPAKSPKTYRMSPSVPLGPFWGSGYGCFRKSWYPQIIRFNRVFHYKSSILRYPYFWKHPYIWVLDMGVATWNFENL